MHARLHARAHEAHKDHRKEHVLCTCMHAYMHGPTRIATRIYHHKDHAPASRDVASTVEHRAAVNESVASGQSDSLAITDRPACLYVCMHVCHGRLTNLG